MAEIDFPTDEVELRQVSTETAVVLAIRAALRAVPALVFLLGRNRMFRRRDSTAVVLAVFRALQCAWFAAANRHGLDDVWIHRAAEYAERFARSVGDEGRKVLFVPAYAAYAASGNNVPYTAAIAIDDAPEANRFAAYSTAFPRSREETADRVRLKTIEAYKDDYALLLGGMPPRNLATRPLWPKRETAWTRNAWGWLKTALYTTEEHWNVWIDWYEQRLKGESPNEALDFGIAAMPDDKWTDASPRAINDLIRTLGMPYNERLLPDVELPEVPQSRVLPGGVDAPSLESVPHPERLAIQFGGSQDGLIDLAPASLPNEHLDDSTNVREDYAELRGKASDLQALGPNRLGRLGVPIERFLSLPGDVRQVRSKLFWSRINTLRVILDSHDQAVAMQTPEPDERKLEPSVVPLLKDLVETANVFVVGDPTLLELDAARPGPQEIASAKEEVALLDPVLKGAVGPANVATEPAQDALKEQLENMLANDRNLHERQAVEFCRRTVRNFASELLRRAYAPIRAQVKSESDFAWKSFRDGAYQAAGAAAITGAATDLLGVTSFHQTLVEFVVQHADTLIAYVEKAFQNPALVEIINFIVRLEF